MCNHTFSACLYCTEVLLHTYIVHDRTTSLLPNFIQLYWEARRDVLKTWNQFLFIYQHIYTYLWLNRIILGTVPRVDFDPGHVYDCSQVWEDTCMAMGGIHYICAILA